MNKRRGVIWLLAGLVLALAAAGLSYFAFQQLITQQASTVEEAATQSVVVAKQLVNERAVIRLADIGTEERPRDQVPSGAIFKTEDAVGRIALRPIASGQLLLTQNLAESFPSTGGVEPGKVVTETVNFNDALGGELVAYALPAADLLSTEGILLPGDRVDLLFSTDVTGQQEGTGGKVAVYAIQDLELLQIIYQPPPPQTEEERKQGKERPPLVPKTLILAMEPQDAVTLKYAVDIEAPINLALRAQDNRRDFDVDAVTINTIADRYDFGAPRPIP
jgi:Flp pilus assembly protein CpaB